MREPETDVELEDAIESAGYLFADCGDSFKIECKDGGAVTRLEADNLSDALFEAWNMVKPDMI